MYEAHFRLARKPFAMHPEPDMMYWAEGHKMARTMMVYGLTGTHGIVVITGEVGSGKTTLLSHLINEDRSGHVLGRLNGGIGLGNDVPAWVLFGFGVEGSASSTTENVERLKAFLTKVKQRRRKAVVFIDEAQLLSEYAIEQLRLLSDMTLGGTPVLQLVLLGQPELARILNQPQLVQFRQRIVSHYHLKSFSPAEVQEYIATRLRKSGAPGEMFTEDALEAVHELTGGVPRRINMLCDTALVYAFAQGQRLITRDTLEKVQSDRETHGLVQIG